jgi:hypothetical protein
MPVNMSDLPTSILPADWATSQFGTHAPVLRAAIERTTGPIIELGMGNYSSRLIHHLARGRPTFSVDETKDWMARFTDLSGPTHHIVLCPFSTTNWPDWNMVPYQMARWSVALVDQHPASGRLVSIAALENNCEFIIAHDTEQSLYFYEPLFRNFKYRYDHKALTPWTTVVSNVRPFDPV